MCDEDPTTTKRWAPFSPPDNFDVADATCPVSWVLATRGCRGGAPEGRVEGVVGTLLIVELGSPIFFGKHCAVGCNNSAKKYGTPTNKVSLQTKSGAGNTMVMSELTRGVDMMDGVISIFNKLNLWACDPLLRGRGAPPPPPQNCKREKKAQCVVFRVLNIMSKKPKANDEGKAATP